MRLFTDGAEFQDVLAWNTAVNVTAVTTQARSGLASYWSGSVSQSLTLNLPSDAEYFIRWCVYPQSVERLEMKVKATPAGTVLGGVKWIANDFKVYTGDLATLLYTATGAPYVINNWYMVEWHIKIANAGGVSDLKIDGHSVGTFAGDTDPTAGSTIQELYFAPRGHWMDDIAVNNTSNADGLNDNSWCGDGKIELLKPDGNGYLNQWTGQDGDSVNNYLNVDEIPYDSDTTYNENGTATNKDAYGITNWTGTNKIPLRVWTEARARDTVSTGNQFKMGLRSGGANYLTAALNLLTSYKYFVGTQYKTDPAGGAWDDAKIDALEALVETV